MSIFGEAVRERRIELGIDQKALAESVGVPASTLCRWEKGRGQPDFIAGVQLACALQFDPVALAQGCLAKMQVPVDKSRKKLKLNKQKRPEVVVPRA